ncbi:hypothetical protein HY642_02595 [Candidatus Woesearchaeota archaeon]|nr:hypothetical protein [Candidatus Woesearchaeota archaeon]
MEPHDAQPEATPAQDTAPDTAPSPVPDPYNYIFQEAVSVMQSLKLDADYASIRFESMDELAFDTDELKHAIEGLSSAEQGRTAIQYASRAILGMLNTTTRQRSSETGLEYAVRISIPQSTPPAEQPFVDAFLIANTCQELASYWWHKQTVKGQQAEAQNKHLLAAEENCKYTLETLAEDLNLPLPTAIRSSQAFTDYATLFVSSVAPVLESDMAEMLEQKFGDHQVIQEQHTMRRTVEGMQDFLERLTSISQDVTTMILHAADADALCLRYGWPAYVRHKAIEAYAAKHHTRLEKHSAAVYKILYSMAPALPGSFVKKLSFSLADRIIRGVRKLNGESKLIREHCPEYNAMQEGRKLLLPYEVQTAAAMVQKCSNDAELRKASRTWYVGR